MFNRLRSPGTATHTTPRAVKWSEASTTLGETGRNLQTERKKSLLYPDRKGSDSSRLLTQTQSVKSIRGSASLKDILEDSTGKSKKTKSLFHTKFPHQLKLQLSCQEPNCGESEVTEFKLSGPPTAKAVM